MKTGESRSGRPQRLMEGGFPFLAAFFALVTVTAFGQTPPTRMLSGGGTASSRGGYSATAKLGPAPAFLPAQVTGQPYSGEEITESSQTLADGTRLTRTVVRQRVNRDGQGRMRVEHPILQAFQRGPAVDVPPIVEITDPISGVFYVLDMQNRVAFRSAVRTPPTPPTLRGGVPIPQSRPSRDGVQTLPQAAPKVIIGARRVPAVLPPGVESLGKQEIDGVTAEGMRTTQTIAAGAQGNDRDIVVTTDTWKSEELRITMLRKITDPRSGETTFRIQNFIRAEPDFTLFFPPGDYVIKDEPGPFSITYSKP